MNSTVFALLLAAGCAGILISFVRARSRAIFLEDGFVQPGRRTVAVFLLAAVLLLTVAIPFAGGLAGAEPATKDFTLVSLFAVHLTLVLFLTFYYALSGRRSLPQFLKLKSARPAADLGAGFLIGFAGWLLTIVVLLIVIGLWYVLFRHGAPTPVGSKRAWPSSPPVGSSAERYDLPRSDASRQAGDARVSWSKVHE